MKHEFAIRHQYDGDKKFSLHVRTRVDVIAEGFLDQLKATLKSKASFELADVFETLLHAATFFECKTNYYLRRAIEVAMQNDYDEEFSRLVFECIERQQIEKKLQLLAGLRHYPEDISSKVSRIQQLVDKRNFLVHFKARTDKIELDDFVIASIGTKIIGSKTSFDQSKVPNPPWLDELLGLNLIELIDEVIEIGKWMDESFIVTKYWKGPSAVQSLVNQVTQLREHVAALTEQQANLSDNQRILAAGRPRLLMKSLLAAAGGLVTAGLCSSDLRAKYPDPKLCDALQAADRDAQVNRCSRVNHVARRI